MASPGQAAHQACGPCKKNKRKCDKQLPICSLCERTGRVCDYEESQKPPPTAAEFAALQARMAELEDRLSTSMSRVASTATSPLSDSATLAWTDQSYTPTAFPSAMFLDADCYEWAGMRLPKPTVKIPLEVLGLLNERDGVLEISEAYFTTIHRWMPMISKKQIDIGIPFQDSGPDLATLFLAMKLIISPSQSEDENTGTSLYHVCKSFLATLEAHGVLSLRCLQAMILMALYEYSHAIYPAAWMTVGACSRYIDIIGLSNPGQVSKIIRPCTTWTEVEERRRVWWAAYVIDRVISLGSRRRFSMPDPSDTDVLPVDDFVWDSGDVTQVLNYTVLAPFAVIQSPFARLCYSAICVSRVAECRRSSQSTASEKTTAVVTLTETLYALSTSLEESLSQANSIEEYLDSLGPRCLTWSALFMLLDTYCCPEQLQDEPGYNLAGGGKTPEEQMLQVQASFIVRSISEQVHTTAVKLMEILDASPQEGAQLGRISGFCLDSFYCAMATFHWILRESGDETIRFSLEDVKRCMRQLEGRWRLASEYLALEEGYTRAGAT